VRKRDRELASRDAYVAGPSAMMRPAMKALAERGIAREAVYSDAYHG
jgi:NAD(P)H-flavin reductase